MAQVLDSDSVNQVQNIGILNARQINLVYISLSYSLRCETRHWSACDETSWLYIFLPKQLRESKYHTLVQCSLAMIIFNNALHASLTQHNSYMSFPNNHSVDSQFAIFISKVLEHQECLLTFTQSITWKPYTFCS